jgi:hypothetical protein
MKRATIVIGATLLVVSFGAGLGVGYVWGGIRGSVDAKRNRFKDDKAVIDSVLSTDQAFARIEVDAGLDGYAFLSGDVERETDYFNLRTKLIEAFGIKQTDRMIAGVRIRKKGL